MRAMLWAGGLVVALAALIGAGRLWAEGKDQKPAKPAPRTRIGLINLTYVMKNYKKYTKFLEEIEEIAKPFQERDAKLRKQFEKLTKKKEKQKVVPATSEDTEEALKKLQREIEDNNAEGRRAVGKRSEHEMKILYLDVLQAAQRYAVAHDFDLVLHYNDAISKEEYVSAANIRRKVETGALLPVYTAQGMDISIEIVKLLNDDKEKDAP